MKRLDFSIHIAGDQSILVEFGNTIDEQTNQKVRYLAEQIEENHVIGVTETILGYTNLLIQYDPINITYEQLEENIVKLLDEKEDYINVENRMIEIPVLYGSHYGPDLEDVARLNGLTKEEVIQIHTESIYTVYFLGFSPGFPFLGGMSEKIITPRLENPRTQIPAGSVGIANNQTGIYPVSSPGGWRLIGHTPLLLYDQTKEWPFLLSPGDRLQFKSISQEQYDKLIKKVVSN